MNRPQYFAPPAAFEACVPDRLGPYVKLSSRVVQAVSATGIRRNIGSAQAIVEIPFIQSNPPHAALFRRGAVGEE